MRETKAKAKRGGWGLNSSLFAARYVVSLSSPERVAQNYLSGSFPFLAAAQRVKWWIDRSPIFSTVRADAVMHELEHCVITPKRNCHT